MIRLGKLTCGKPAFIDLKTGKFLSDQYMRHLRKRRMYGVLYGMLDSDVIPDKLLFDEHIVPFVSSNGVSR